MQINQILNNLKLSGIKEREKDIVVEMKNFDIFYYFILNF